MRSIISTEPASAKAVALAVQEAGWLEIKGIIAEDSTIFLATASLSDQKVLLHRIAQMQDDVRRCPPEAADKPSGEAGHGSSPADTASNQPASQRSRLAPIGGNWR